MGSVEDVAIETQKRTRRSGICDEDGETNERWQSPAPGDLSDMRSIEDTSFELASVSPSAQQLAFAIGSSRGGHASAARPRGPANHAGDLYARGFGCAAGSGRTIGTLLNVPKLFPSCGKAGFKDGELNDCKVVK